MSSKMYRSAAGKTVDMGKLLLQNEEVMAVGNMNVNARGDQINTKNNRTIQTRSETVSKHYEKQVVSNVVDEPIYSSASAVPVEEPAVKTTTKAKTARNAKKKEPVESGLPETSFDDEVFSSVPLVDIEEEVEEAAPVGLAAAIARAKEVKQEPLPNPKKPSKPTRF